MRQRVMIALALSCDPSILIADEPTTALDVTIQAQILERIRELREQTGRGRDTRDARPRRGRRHRRPDRGDVRGPDRGAGHARRDLLRPPAPLHVGSARLDHARRPPPARAPAGHRGPAAVAASTGPRAATSGRAARTSSRKCSEVPPLESRAEGDAAHTRPLLADGRGEARAARGDGRARSASAEKARGGGRRERATVRGALLEVEHLKLYFPIKQGVIIRPRGGARARRRRRHVRAARGRDARAGRRVGLRQDHALARADAADRRHRGRDPLPRQRHHEGVAARQMQPLRREMQMVFQDPFASLNPRKRVGQIVGTPLRLHGAEKVRDRAEGARAARAGRARARALEPIPARVLGRPAPAHRRRPGARAGARLIVLDEPVSALDVSVQAQIINLLDDLQDDFGLTYMFVAHDLSVVRHVSDRIAVMYLGKLMEVSPAEELYTKPIHPYTRRCWQPSRSPTRGRTAARKRVVGDRRASQPDRPAVGLRLPSALPPRHRHLPRGGAAADALRERAPGGLPPPSERDRGGDRGDRKGPLEPEELRRRDACSGRGKRRRGRLTHENLGSPGPFWPCT